MKRVFIILCAVLAAACSKPDIIPGPDTQEQPGAAHDSTPGSDQTPGGQDIPRLIPVLPESGEVPEVRITITDKDWQTLLDAFNKNNNTQGHP